MTHRYDVVVAGSGVGGATTALRLAETGLSVLVLERGGFIPSEKENWDTHEVFAKARYASRDEMWAFGDGKPQFPLAYYNVGGASKVFGAVLTRLRERDFGEITYHDGVSPAWPIDYADLEPYYCQAENLFGVHGNPASDPTEPYRSAPLPYGPVDHEGSVQDVVYQLTDMGLHPYNLPLCIDRHNGGSCVRCSTCDGFPCMVRAKNDAERAAVSKLLELPNARVLTNAKVERIECAEEGDSISHFVVTHNDSVEKMRAKIFVLSAGAINSAAILLKSKSDRRQNGLANSSGAVGRHYMAHNSSVVLAVGVKETRTVFQKTFGLNDFYFGDEKYRHPMGNIQMIGKVNAEMLRTMAPYVPKFVREYVTSHSIEWYAQSEDLPHLESRVTVGDDGMIRLTKQRTNERSHAELIRRVKRYMRKVGFPIVVSRRLDLKTTSHQCGTIRFGTDRNDAALDQFCRSYDHPNLFIVDGSFMPSSAGMNPALTIAAQALRAADHIASREFAAGT
jgi:choline dehydrogenase-like flavoprotein